MGKEVRMKMKKQARLARGLLNILRDDIELIRIDTEEHDLMSLKESIIETKDTLRRLLDSVVELEYVLYLAEDDLSRR